jgi:hypothetical protein
MADARKRARSFGTARRLPSGRWQVRYYDQAGIRHTAPRTFPSKADANRYLAQVEADLLRGAWTDPRPPTLHLRRVGGALVADHSRSAAGDADLL